MLNKVISSENTSNQVEDRKMKPRNDKQRQILVMSGQLRPLTTAQKNWALTHTIDNYALKYKKGKAVCLICGKEFEAEEGKCTCPHCGAKLEVKTTTQRVVRGKVILQHHHRSKGFPSCQNVSDDSGVQKGNEG